MNATAVDHEYRIPARQWRKHRRWVALMGWSIGYDSRWDRDIGYGVPAVCDEPDCSERIDRGLGYVCGGQPYGGEQGCGLYFCEAHRWYGEQEDARALCQRCNDGEPAYEPKPDVTEWLQWKLTDDSWRPWREKHPDQVTLIQQQFVSGGGS